MNLKIETKITNSNISGHFVIQEDNGRYSPLRYQVNSPNSPNTPPSPGFTTSAVPAKHIIKIGILGLLQEAHTEYAPLYLITSDGKNYLPFSFPYNLSLRTDNKHIYYSQSLMHIIQNNALRSIHDRRYISCRQALYKSQ